KRHQSSISSAVKDFNNIMTGRKKLPYSILDDAVKNATKALRDAQTELKFSDNGILAIDKKDPNKVVLFNSAGIGVSTNGGAEFRTAMTGDGLIADVVTAGTLNADQVAIQGGNGNEYLYMSGNIFEQRGTYKRTWQGIQTTHDTKIKIQNGHLRFRNDNLQRSLYISEFGMSTYIDGDGAYLDEGGSSGTLNWWDETYSEEGRSGRGITLHSHNGKPAIVSNHKHVVIHPLAELSSKLFYFSKSEDGHDGYIMHSILSSNGATSDEPRGGLRFVNSTRSEERR